MSCKALGQLVVLAVLGVASGQATAGVSLRVEAWPIIRPLDAFVLVTDHGSPVTDITAADFRVKLDGVELQEFGFQLPPSQDPAQQVSVVIVADGLHVNERGWSALLAELAVGDYVSVVKYWGDIERIRFGGMEVLPFTRIDGDAGLDAVTAFLGGPAPTRFGRGVFHTEALLQGLHQFRAPPATLPRGPKAVLTLGPGVRSLSNVVALANEASIPVFNVGYAGWRSYRDVVAQTRALAEKTGGVQVPLESGEPARRAIARMALWLKHGYRISIPQSAITDCKPRTLEISVRGRAVSTRVVRCDTTPDRFEFPDLGDTAVDTTVVSDARFMTDLETAAPIRVFGGEYSIGCGSTFTSAPGRILPGRSVCVRHTTASQGGLEAATLLIVGGEASWFVSSTLF